MADPIDTGDASPAQRGVSRLTLIYTLSDPRTGEIRYVGKTTKTLKRRLQEHLNDAQSQKKPFYVYRWIRGLTAAGELPLIREIAVAGSDWAEQEQHWIAFYRDSGARLTNATVGGEGVAGLIWGDSSRELQRINGLNRSAETRAKMSAAAIRRAAQPGEKERRSAARKGKLHTDEARVQIGKSNTGKKRSADICAKFTAAQLLRYSNPDARAVTSAAAVKRYTRQEERDLASARTSAQLASPEARAALSARTRAHYAKLRASKQS
jgi:hypothetical protein